MPSHARRAGFTLLLAACLFTSACSRVDLAYRHLDTLIPWQVGRYVDLDKTQRASLNKDVEKLLGWHCSTQMPMYAAWLGELEQHVRSATFDVANVDQVLSQLNQAVDAIAVEATLPSASVLASLTDTQVKQIEKRFADQRQEDHTAYLAPSLDAQIDERAERAAERAEGWLGLLNKEQRTRIQTWSAALGEQNKHWLESRAQWQSAFIEALHLRAEDGFTERIGHLLQERDQYWTPTYQYRFPAARSELASMIADLYALAPPAQRERLARRIAQTRQQVESVACSA